MVPSIIEQITQAEAEAASIKKDAQAKAREAVAQANVQAREAVEKAKELGRDKVRTASQAAEAEGRDTAKKIRNENAKRADTQCEAASEKLPKAVDYILERIVKV